MTLFFSRIPLGLRFMILSALGFSCMGVFVKLASVQGIPVLEIVAARALVSLCLSYADVRRKRISLLGNNKALLCARALAGTAALGFVYYAIANLPYAEATVLQYLHPMFTAILAIFFLKERLTIPVIVCIALSFLGLLVIVRPEFLFQFSSIDATVNYQWFAIFAAIAGAFGSGVAYILVRKLSATEDPSVIIIYFPLFALPASLLMLGKDFVMPQGEQWLILLLVGVMTQIGQVGLTKAMQTETASRATSFSYIQVVFAIILGWVFFAEVPSIWVYIGAGMIIAGALMNVLLAKKQKKAL